MNQFRIWIAASSILTLSCLGWTVLSGQFEYGQRHADRPILEFLALYFLAWLAFVTGSLLLSRNAPDAPWKLILATGLLARLVLLPSNLIQENDVYRYVLDGQALRHGVNPFQYPPRDAANLAPEPFAAELRTPQAERVLSRVGHPEIPTIYPPAAQVIFSAGAWLGGWNWMGQRWLFLVADLAIAGLLVHLLHLAQLPLGWVLLYAWNPLVLKEVTNSMHVDVWAGLFVLLTLLCLARCKGTGGFLWPLLAGAALGVAVLVKLYPALLLPATILFLSRPFRGPEKKGTVYLIHFFPQEKSELSRLSLFFPAVAFLVGTLVTILIGVAAFLSVGFAQLTAGLSIYAEHWVMNAGAYSLLSQMFPDARPVAALLIATFAFMIPWRRESRQWISLVVDFQWVLLLWFLFIPTPFPWYALGLLAILPLNPRFSAPAVAGLCLSGLFALYYLNFFYEYHGYPVSWWAVTRGVEHGLVWGSLIIASAFAVFRGKKRVREGHQIPSELPAARLH